ncbi:uncharacterized protein LOC141689954 isoform X2 [Apium graveolens]|uniref:uncharacterized protein LOC141689954 isoform X2 n=1 Tax=Apium graveolens TaxID=4045 RepID=UPI003D7B4C05
MDRSWINVPNKLSPEYADGIDEFIKVASKQKNSTGMVLCPCCRCVNKLLQNLKVIRLHLLTHGFLSTYKIWYCHGEQVDDVEDEVTLNSQYEDIKDDHDVLDVGLEDVINNSRSVRMGLASDGFNPFSNLTSTYSLCPVILIPYNMPPWASPNGTNYLTSLLIPGTKSPGKDYDVFLKPLIEGLKELWDGVDVYNSYGGCIFKLRAAVLWIISDFPGHQCYLNANHSWRKSREYDGSSELRGTPRTFTGEDILKQLEEVPVRTNEQVLQGGPVHSRWMFETERHMGLYKRYVRNMARPDSSIAEAYIVDEAEIGKSLFNGIS